MSNSVNIPRYLGALLMASGVSSLALLLLAPKIDDNPVLNQAFNTAANAQIQTPTPQQTAPTSSAASLASNAPTPGFPMSGTVDIDDALPKIDDELKTLNKALAKEHGELQTFKAMYSDAIDFQKCIDVGMIMTGGALFAFQRKKPAPSGPGPT